MCGIAGILELADRGPVGEHEIRRMLAMIRHRGPDEFGIYLDGRVGLGSARLSIIDLSTGQQPISNEDGTLWIVFNGEIFNYVELRPQLEGKGHRFTTTSDTEVLLHAYEEWGEECLERFNGQFAFAIWNTRDRSLFLARDRLGVRPLFYSLAQDTLIFGSEIKTLLASGRIRAELEPTVIEQVFTYWCPVSPGTAFRGVLELPPGHYLLARDGRVSIKSYWELSFPTRQESVAAAQTRTPEDYEEELAALLIDATKIRLRADVPVGAYLSGGLDSSLLTAIIRNHTSNRLDTFSIAFDDVDFDESAFQRKMAQFLGTEHQVVQATHVDIAKVFPDVIWHTEVPVMRTAPAPMFMLSKRVRESGYKVVLTGEGADEFLAGYDIFKEAKVRRFWAIQPDSRWRPQLLRRLYPDIPGLARSNTSVLAAFFREGLGEVQVPEYSHALRWRNGRRNCRFLSEEMRPSGQPHDVAGGMAPKQLAHWEPLARAQYWEIKFFLSEYLLSSQGDRMGMANSIEGRFPFLDCRVVNFCNQLPARLKLKGLTEKYLLKRLGRRWLPDQIWRRPKRPYRAPIHRSFFNASAPEYVGALISPEAIRRTGLFRPSSVSQLVEKARRGLAVSESDDMALAVILSTQLLHRQFVENFRTAPPLSEKDSVKVRRGCGSGAAVVKAQAASSDANM